MLRFTTEAVAIVAAANVLLLVGMFWVGYLRGKAAARSEVASLASDANGQVPLRQDAKQEWDGPKSDGLGAARDPSSQAGTSTQPGTSKSESLPTNGATAEPTPEIRRNAWVVQANSYALSKLPVAQSWKKTLIEAGFADVEVYQMGEKNPMLGLCVGWSEEKDKQSGERELEQVWQQVKQFRSKDEHPFEGAIVTQIAVKRK